MRGLPEGWVEVELGEVVEPKETRNPRTDGSKSFRYIDVQAVDNDRNRVGVAQEVASKSAPSRARRLVRRDDVLFCLVRPYLRNIAMVPDHLDGQVASTAFCVLRSIGAVLPRFLFHYVTQDQFIKGLPTYGNSPPSAREDEFLAQQVPLPPVPDQHRIVAKIESLFARLDDGVAALKRAAANLERYRASVLKAAVEGRLTEQWRRKNPPEETGEQLLERILVERQKRWEAEQLAKFEAKGRKPPRHWRAKYREPVAPDTSGLPELPEGWCWATVDQFSNTASGGTPDRKRDEFFGGGVPWVKSGELRDSVVMRTEETLSMEGLGASSAKVFPAGTLCIALYGATVGKLGTLGVDSATNQAVCAILRPIGVLPQYLAAFFRSIRPKLVKMGKGGAQPNISQTIVRATPVPVPPLGEQEAIVTFLDVTRLRHENTRRHVTDSCAAASALRQSILKRAFKGRLVVQNSADLDLT